MKFLKQRVCLICLMACLGVSSSIALASRDSVELDAHIATYFKLLESRDTTLLDYYEQLASKSFTCQWRDERLYNREEWAAILKAYLNDDTTTLKYEYRVVSKLQKGSDTVVIRLVATEVRRWQDREGFFGPAGHVLEYRECFDIDFVFVNYRGSWMLDQLALYGLEKRLAEQPR